MASQKLLLFLLFFSLFSLLSISAVGQRTVRATTFGHDSRHRHHHHSTHSTGNKLSRLLPSKLFVFGDSYADTGNKRKSESTSWQYPYGISFPGKPTGRFSDGRVLTDYLAKYMSVKSPIPYKWRKVVSPKQLTYGMNFAYGGTGVFNTWVLDPNMTTQIDLFQRLINDSVYSLSDLQSSVALVSLAGNDYGFRQRQNPSPTVQDWHLFMGRVVSQLGVNLKRIKELGVKKILVTGLEPFGCLPSSTVSYSFKQCNESQNALVNFHNVLLQQTVAQLSNQTKYNASSSDIIILDLHTSFLSVIQNKGPTDQGSKKFVNPLMPCCVGISKEYSCGSVTEKGEKKYTICKDPESSFFWDSVHPTQAGWRAVSSNLLAALEQLL